MLADGEAASVRLANTKSVFAALRDWQMEHCRLFAVAAKKSNHDGSVPGKG